MKTAIGFAVIAVVLSLPAVGLAREQASSQVTATAAKGATTIKVRKGRYGRYLTDGRGRTLYLFTRDKGKPRSTCYGECEDAWPIVSGRPKLAKGLKGRVGTTRRKDRRVQATFNGHPLYYYVGETKAGQILCQDVFEYGGDWLIIAPSGRAIR